MSTQEHDRSQAFFPPLLAVLRSITALYRENRELRLKIAELEQEMIPVTTPSLADAYATLAQLDEALGIAGRFVIDPWELIARVDRITKSFYGSSKVTPQPDALPIMDQSAKRKAFEAVVRPVIAWLNENCHPHCAIEIDQTTAQLREGQISVSTNDYVRD